MRLRRLIDALNPLGRLRARLLLSRAKHPSLQGHGRIAARVARLVPMYEYGADQFFATDGAPEIVAARRRAAFERLKSTFEERAPKTLEASAALAGGVSDLAFVNAYRVPFQYRRYVQENLRVGCLVAETDGARMRDLDGNWSWDLGGDYGVNLFGREFYKLCIERGVARARAVGLVLGPYHPIIADNVARLKAISGMDEVSFHMSGTEAVMQAVRLARYHTRRSHIVRFCGAYHGWWDGVQTGVGNPRPPGDVYTLKEMDDDTLCVLATRDDIACVLVNPIQAMHPNGAPPNDSTLVSSNRAAGYHKARYTDWLKRLRAICTERSIVLLFDEVFLGFRLAAGGAQEYFGVRADMVTYGKSLGGGLPVGAVCGRRDLMRRFRDDHPVDVCFARGTFNSHPYVMATMNEFLRHLDEPATRALYQDLDARWDARASDLNHRLLKRDLPLRFANMTSIFTTLFDEPSRYNWMFQYYLRAHGLSPSWIGSGRFIFSLDLSDKDFAEIGDRLISAAEAMQSDGWWWNGEALTNRAIHRRVLREMVSAGLGRGPSDRATAP